VNQLSKSIIFWLAVIVVIIFLVRQVSPDPTKKITLTEFSQYVSEGLILEANISDDKIEGKMLNEKNRDPGQPESYEASVLALEAANMTERLLDHNQRIRESARSAPAQEIAVTNHNSPTWLISLLTYMLPLALFVGLWFFFLRQMQLGGTKAMSFGKSRARLNTDSKNRVTFVDVAGCDEAKEELQEVIEFLKDPRRFQKLGGKIPKGVLLFGAPGTGKTLLARAVAGEANVPFFSISGSDFVEMFVGVGASRVRDLFEQGKKSAPCIIFIDEIDAVGRHRFAGIGGGHDEREQTLNALLVEMDGFVTNEGVILIAATNRPDVLDPALLRPGRFDRQITVDLPDLGGRKGILEVHTRNVVLHPEVNLDTLARRTPGFSGADLANVCNEAALLGARRKKDAVDMLDFEDAIDRVMAGPEKKSRIISADEKKIIAYHEAGHALMYLYIDEIDPLHKVSILPRGRALGYTMQLPTDDKFLTSKMELLGNITALLGGRVSEELVFNEVWTGSTNDLERATILAHKMVCEFGMSDKLGPLTFGNSGHEVFLGMDLGRERSYSEEIAFEIDKEVRAIVDGSHARARKLLEEHRDDLEALANALLEREVLDKEEVFRLLGLPGGKGPQEPPTAVATGGEEEKGAKGSAIDLGPEPQPA